MLLISCSRDALLSVSPLSNDTIYCYPLNNIPPTRRTDGFLGLSSHNKMIVSPDYWPVEKYPDYCLGWVYALVPSLAERLSGATDQVPVNIVDDLYITGFLKTAISAKIEMLSTSWLLRSFIWKWVSR